MTNPTEGNKGRVITDHKFRNLCGSACNSCRRDRDNRCSSIGGHTNYRPCHKTREEHAEVEDWSTLLEPSYASEARPKL